ncbi:M48 family metallopeptidase [Pseudoprimorskyibacter insulae]|uniref:YgjP-like metallopeptidase domain-containing protein n=1 Tax=Pseudoprimorskyibacter insulae TaxID=1695997 RepID=A0A2R8AV43_9RHOB|nr:SprT family zinc-dependent metalloprotease [Pseudoprimorskyibacter insulae]SPF79870.1 hypothetical protein PRI8871_01671 [Pseudoprimorskyibacter insulae]
MGELELPGNPPIALVVRRSARARRISLRLSQLDGRVTLTLPQRLPLDEGLEFAREKEQWLRDHLQAQGAVRQVGIGEAVPLEGRMVPVVAGQGRRVVDTGDALAVPGAADQVAKRLEAYLKQRARDRLAEASDHYAAKLGRPYTRLTLRDTRSRWGSCSADGKLMYSWRLVLAPAWVLRYVAAHEVAHLAEMNHSQRFWDVVTDLYGPWKDARGWLHENGADLHRYRFGN